MNRAGWRVMDIFHSMVGSLSTVPAVYTCQTDLSPRVLLAFGKLPLRQCSSWNHELQIAASFSMQSLKFMLYTASTGRSTELSHASTCSATAQVERAAPWLT